jgi:hypothetical protein
MLPLLYKAMERRALYIFSTWFSLYKKY